MKKQPQVVDPALAALFQNSVSTSAIILRTHFKLTEFELGPAKSTSKSLLQPAPQAIRNVLNDPSVTPSEIDNASGKLGPNGFGGEAPVPPHSSAALQSLERGNNHPRPSRKRKRQDAEDDVEGRYLDELARAEAKEQENRLLKVQQRHHELNLPESAHTDDSSLKSNRDSVTEDNDVAVGYHHQNTSKDIPQHESLVSFREDLDLEKSSRTVFLANVSTLAITSKTARKALLDHLTSFTASLQGQDKGHAIESLRFRSTAFSSSAIPKKAAFVKKELKDTTTKSTNAYAVCTTRLVAREAVKKLNGSTVLGRHLRVDLVAHPAKIDHRRCVFVGNLGFVDDVTNIQAAEDEENKKTPRKTKEPADVEEGLWRQFGHAGVVESVRVVRDKTTRVGKGFAYVQFQEANAVEKALLYNGKKFPPMLPRTLRVVRAKAVKKAASWKEKSAQSKTKMGSTANNDSKVPAKLRSMKGRAGRLFGQAGAAQIRGLEEKHDHLSKIPPVQKSPESVVFEGYRASRQQGQGALKMGRLAKSKGKPSTRSSRRGASFRAKGGKRKLKN